MPRRYDTKALEEAVASVRRWNERGWGRARCPFCFDRTAKPDHRRSFAANRETGRWRCHKCNAWGLLPGYEQQEADEDRYAPPTFSFVEAVRDGALDLPESFALLYGEGDGATARVLDPARRYLLRRGVTEQQARDARVGACTSGPVANRVVVPAMSRDGLDVVGWTARSWLRGASPKYLTADDMHRDEHLLNEPALDAQRDEPLLLVEGAFDALPYWPDVVAFLGKPTRWQVEQVATSRRVLVAALDGDAWQESEALALRLRLLGATAAWVKLPPTKDPGNVDREIFSGLVDSVSKAARTRQRLQ